MWATQIFALIQTCFEFTGPILVSRIIKYIQTPNSEISGGLLLILLFVVSRIGLILVSAQGMLNNVRF